MPENRTITTPSVHKKEAYHHGDLREQLVRATRLLVEEKGPEGFSVAEAARKAGVSSAAPYRHFRDRAAMLSAVAEDGMTRLQMSLAEAAAGFPAGSTAAIAAMGIGYVAFAEAEPNVFRLMFAANEYDTDDLALAGERCYGQLLEQVARHMGRGEIDDAVRLAAFPLWTLVHGAAFLTIDCKIGKAGAPEPVDAVIRTATARLLGAG